MKKPFPLIKYFYGLLFFISLLLFIAAISLFSFGYHAPVLMYHHINYDQTYSRLQVSPESFEQQMKFLKEKHFQVVDLEVLFDILLSGKKPPSKMIALTFDDGYEDNYHYAYPILKKYNFPATLFLIAKSIGEKNYLTLPQIQEMESHQIRFGNHTLTHPNLTEISLDQAQQEILGGRTLLKQWVKNPASIFCYPVGGSNLDVQSEVKKAGYRAALSTSSNGIDTLANPYAYRRIRISESLERTPFLFGLAASGYYSAYTQVRKKIKRIKPWGKKS